MVDVESGEVDPLAGRRVPESLARMNSAVLTSDHGVLAVDEHVGGLTLDIREHRPEAFHIRLKEIVDTGLEAGRLRRHLLVVGGTTSWILDESPVKNIW